MSNENQETIADIVAEMRLGVKDWKGERLGVFDCFADRIEAAWKLGNAAKMREALERFNAVDLSVLEFPLDGDSSSIYNSNKKEIPIPYWRVAELLNGVKAAQDMAESAISAPPRNCDVGKAEEQYARFYSFCDKYEECKECPLWRGGGLVTKCFARWAQMPYEEGAGDGK